MKYYIEIIGGVEGKCICISHEKDEGGRRVAGPKPWGGGAIVKRFTTTRDSILDAIPLKEIKEYVARKRKKE